MKKISIIILLSVIYQMAHSQIRKRIYLDSDGIAIPMYDYYTYRPAINSVRLGSIIYNNFDRVFQFSDGTKWVNIHGKNSLPEGTLNNTLVNKDEGWVNSNLFKNNGKNVYTENEETPLNPADVFSIGHFIKGISEGGVGVWGIARNNSAVVGNSQNQVGVAAISEIDKGAWAFANHIALRASSESNLALQVSSNSNYSGKFEGRMLMQSGYPVAGIDFENSAESIRGYLGMRDDNEMGIFGYGLNNWVQRWNINTGTICFTTNPTICSDFRLKRDFQKLSNSLSLITDLKGYNYYFKNEKNTNLQTGFIAQEIQKIFPELVKTDKKGYLSVDYVGLIPHLVENEKSLKSANEELEKENNLLEMRLQNLEKLLNVSEQKSNKNAR